MKTTAATAPRMSEIARQSRANLAAKFKMLDTMNALCREFGEPDLGLAVDMVERGLTADEARRELAKRASLRGWSVALNGQSPAH